MKLSKTTQDAIRGAPIPEIAALLGISYGTAERIRNGLPMSHKTALEIIRKHPDSTPSQLFMKPYTGFYAWVNAMLQVGGLNPAVQSEVQKRALGKRVDVIREGLVRHPHRIICRPWSELEKMSPKSLTLAVSSKDQANTQSISDTNGQLREEQSVTKPVVIEVHQPTVASAPKGDLPSTTVCRQAHKARPYLPRVGVRFGEAYAEDWASRTPLTMQIPVAEFRFRYGYTLHDLRRTGLRVPMSADKDFSWAFWSVVSRRVQSAKRSELVKVAA